MGFSMLYFWETFSVRFSASIKIIFLIFPFHFPKILFIPIFVAMNTMWHIRIAHLYMRIKRNPE